jgi:hypothetical protein
VPVFQDQGSDMTEKDIPFWVRTPTGVAFTEVPTRPGGRMPDFCIIGSAKSGTTSLYHYLSAHPGIFPCPIKEPHYFSTDVITARGDDWYRGLYADARPDQICGESSVSYTYYPLVAGTAERMHRANPAMKLIYIVRHPVERIESEALQTMKYLKRVLKEDWLHMALDEFLDMIEDPASPYYSAIIETSKYEQQVRAFEAVFPADQILVLTQRDLRDRPGEMLARCHDFLGLPPGPAVDFGAKRNVTAAFFDGMARDRALRRVQRLPGYGLLRKLLPGSLKSRALAALARPQDRVKPALSPERHAHLEAVLAEQTALFEDRLGQPASRW